jgi:tRNA(Ile)-lysidine synthase
MKNPGPPTKKGGTAAARGERWPPGLAGLLARCTFPEPGTEVVCATSGGPDSLALLALAIAAGCKAHALHVDHGLRPTSSEEAEVARRGAERLGASFEVVKVQVAPGPDLEARSRLARYRVLPEGTLVAHTADDQAETLLINLMRGAGLDGLAGMRPCDGGLRRVRRPILGLRRSETASLVRSLGLEVVSDPSNSEMRFWRNRVRHELLPLLAEISGRDPVPVLCRTAALLADDASLLASLSAGIDPTDARRLQASPRPLALRALRQWLRQGSGEERHPPSLAELERAWAVVTGAARACELAGGARLSRSGGRLRLEGVG